LPVRDAAADIVILAFVLFHLGDPAQAIAEAAPVLSPRGRVGTATWARDACNYSVPAEENAQVGYESLNQRVA
jgi:ubiquinone/menaquinone biosynthesis C-methylase UbiE